MFARSGDVSKFPLHAHFRTLSRLSTHPFAHSYIHLSLHHPFYRFSESLANNFLFPLFSYFFLSRSSCTLSTFLPPSIAGPAEGSWLGVLLVEEEVVFVSLRFSLVNTFLSFNVQLFLGFEEVVSLLLALLLVIIANCTGKCG